MQVKAQVPKSRTWSTWRGGARGRWGASAPPASLHFRRAPLGAVSSPVLPPRARSPLLAGTPAPGTRKSPAAGAGCRDGGVRLGPPAVRRLHSHRAPGQWHICYGVQGLRQGGCGAPRGFRARQQSGARELMRFWPRCPPDHEQALAGKRGEVETA